MGVGPEMPAVAVYCCGILYSWGGGMISVGLVLEKPTCFLDPDDAEFGVFNQVGVPADMIEFDSLVVSISRD